MVIVVNSNYRTVIQIKPSERRDGMGKSLTVAIVPALIAGN